ncbi:MAG TPA: hypothetical protein PKK99_05660 [Bacteroidia bacterium]|nr:hypothetical protein [Bacteroidia bacterium]
MDRVWIEYEWGRKDTPRPLSVLVEFEWIPQIAVFVGFQWNEIIAGILVALASGDARDKSDKQQVSSP